MQNVSYSAKFALSKMSLNTAQKNLLLKTQSSSYFQGNDNTKGNILNSFKFNDYLKGSYNKKNQDLIKDNLTNYNQSAILNSLPRPMAMAMAPIPVPALGSSSTAKLDGYSALRNKREEIYKVEDNSKSNQLGGNKTEKANRDKLNSKAHKIDERESKSTKQVSKKEALTPEQKQQALRISEQTLSKENVAKSNESKNITDAIKSKANDSQETVNIEETPKTKTKDSILEKGTNSKQKADESTKPTNKQQKNNEITENTDKSQESKLEKSSLSQANGKDVKSEEKTIEKSTLRTKSIKQGITNVAHSLGELAIKASLQKKAKGKNLKLVTVKASLKGDKEVTSTNVNKNLVNDLKIVSRETTATDNNKEFSSVKDGIKSHIEQVITDTKSFKNVISKNITSHAAPTPSTLLNQKMESQVLQKFESLINRSKILIKNQKNVKLTANLYPKELGKISLTISMHEGVISGKLLVDNDAVLKLLNEKMQELTSSLSSSDYSLDKFEVGLRQGSSQSSFTNKEQASNGSSYQGSSTDENLSSFEKYNQKIKTEGNIYA